MQIAQTNAIAKIAAVIAGLGLVAMSFASFAPQAQAATDLSAQIAALQAQLAALMAQAGGSSSATTFTMDQTLGSKGAEVTALQNWLISKGYSIPAGATGYFGAQTKAAVAAWQKAAGITPAVGYFGPISRAAANAAGGSTTTTTSTTGLTGAGRLTNVSSLGDITTDIDEGAGITKVVGVSADATMGDVLLQRVDATFVIANSGSQSSNLNKYVSDVNLYIDGKKVATMSADSGDKDTRTWTFRFTNLNTVVKKGATANIYVEVTPITSIGTNETGKTVTAKILTNGLRAAGADGISETYVTSDITSPFTVSSSDAGTLTVSASGNNPNASQVAVSSSTTSGIKVLAFNMKAKNQNVTVGDLKIQLSTSDDNVNDVVTTVKLMKGDSVLKTKTASTGTSGFITFDGIDQTISKDQTTEFSIVVDIKGDSAYPDGTTLNASTTVTGWDVSDANGAGVTPSAAAVGNQMTLTATGITVVKGTITATAQSVSLSGAGDVGQYSIPFTVTAGDTDVFIGSATQTRATTPSASAGGVNYATTTSSSSVQSPTVATSLSAGNVVNGDVDGTAYKVLAGTSRTFTLNVSLVATATGLFGVRITGINYGPTSTLGTTYYTSNLDTFKTTDISLIKH